MKKCSFLSLIAAIAASFVCSCSGRSGSSPGGQSFNVIESGFRQPDSMKLAVYWYWISDNISRDGVIRDLEAMKKVGINRVQIGNIGLDEPGIPYGSVKLFSPEWWEIVHAALKRATELDIEVGIFNCPGWSQSGGPWVTPEQSMRYLASAETRVKGPQADAVIRLPEVAGDAMDDVKIIAYPAPAENGRPATQRSWTIEKKRGEALTLDMSLGEAVPVRTLIFRTEARIIADAELSVKDGASYRLLRTIHIDRSNPALNVGFDSYAPIVIAVPETNAADFRLVIQTEESAGQAVVTLTTQPLVERYPEKTLAKMFQTPLPMWHDYLWERQPEAPAGLCVDPLTVTDLTERVRNGVLTWDVPDGEWVITRTAMRTTGVTNAPASPEGRGLETDKMSKKHIAAHFEAFIGEILRRIPENDRKSFRVVVEDSYETGGLNWTDDMEERFRETYGYSPVPYLPVLNGGVVVGSRDLSDRFLWDLRRLIADRVAYDYVGGLREISNSHGLVTWLENYGHWGFPGEFLLYGGQSDEIGGEFWSEGSLGDIENRAAASCGHIYGKRQIWAESCTSGGPAFSRYPYTMKQRVDRFFTEGINATLLHVYIHQPYEDRTPGMAAWFGNEFNRKNTWFDHMDVFGTYLKRCNLMLQQGLYVADAAYFIGEDAPKMTGVCTPALPRGYSFDYMNADVLLTRASVKEGKLTLPDGMQYSLLVLPQLETMRPEVLRKIKELVDGGLVILGPAPKRSPSLRGYPDSDGEVATLAAALWGDGSEKVRRVGRGMVFADGHSLEDVFAATGVQPDLTVDDDPNALFIHRTLPDGDIYFISNQSNRVISVNPRFRIAGKAPELWNPLTNEVRELKEFLASEETTTVPIELQGFESVFVVFRRNGKPSAAAGWKNFPEKEVVAEISSPWEVTFEPGRRGPEEVVSMNRPEDWSLSADERIRYFSGKAFYKTAFRMEALPDRQLYVDLGKVMVTAKVKVNGTYAGGVWTSPYRLNVTSLLKTGENTLEVEVANNWMNRLIGDLQLPEAARRTWVNVNPWKPDSPLQSSGLLGPVEIQAY